MGEPEDARSPCALRLLLVEGDPVIAGAVRRELERAGYGVDLAATAREGWEKAREPHAALVVDVALPDGPGTHVVTQLRRAGKGEPVLFLAREDSQVELVRIAGSPRAGEHAFLPYLRDLSARLEALLRHEHPDATWRIAYAGVELDRIGHRAWYHGTPLELTPTEYRFLECLVLHADEVVTRETLREGVWGPGVVLASNVVDVHVSNLRRKLEAGGRPRIIWTERGRGFVLSDASGDGPKGR